MPQLDAFLVGEVAPGDGWKNFTSYSGVAPYVEPVSAVCLRLMKFGHTQSHMPSDCSQKRP